VKWQFKLGAGMTTKLKDILRFFSSNKRNIFPDAKEADSHRSNTPLYAGIKSLRSTLPDEAFLLGNLLLEPCISLIYA
jgi:hypothetical protein